MIKQQSIQSYINFVQLIVKNYEKYLWRFLSNVEFYEKSENRDKFDWHKCKCP